MVRLPYHQTLLSLLFLTATAAGAADTGIASDHMLSRPKSTSNLLENTEAAQRVRIPVHIQAWNAVTTRGAQGGSQTSRIPTKPLQHVLRARMERPNDFYLGDWRIQTTPIRWLKNTNQYQVRLELFRRYGEAGQLEESLGSLNLTGVLSKQADGLFVVQGSARRRFNDPQGQPVVEIEAGTTNKEERPTALSKMTTDAAPQTK